MCRRTEKEVGPTDGLPTPETFNVLVQATTRGQPLNGYSDKLNKEYKQTLFLSPPLEEVPLLRKMFMLICYGSS